MLKATAATGAKVLTDRGNTLSRRRRDSNEARPLTALNHVHDFTGQRKGHMHGPLVIATYTISMRAHVTNGERVCFLNIAGHICSCAVQLEGGKVSITEGQTAPLLQRGLL
jgi:hypothetical protein